MKIIDVNVARYKVNITSDCKEIIGARFDHVQLVI